MKPHGLDSIFRSRAGEAEPARFAWRYETLKLFGETWVRVGHWQARDADQLDRHARAMGGRVRLVKKKTGEVLVEWVEGKRER